MTLVDKSTMGRYRPLHRKNERSTLVIMNGIFLICFTVYQVMSSGGRGAVTHAAYKPNLKGGLPPRDSADTVYGGDPPVDVGKTENRQYEQHQPETTPKIQEEQSTEGKEKEIARKILLDHDPFSKENEVKTEDSEETEVDIPQKFLDHDPFSKENEVKIQEDILGSGGGGDVAPKEYVFNPDHQMFHNYYKGKSGKVVEEMLIAHAYIFHQNATYGGCCGSRSQKMTQHEDLLEALGLKDILRFRCPRDFVQDTKTKRSVIPKDHYLSEDTHVWTPEYVDYLRSLVTYPERQHKDYTIVVHMLRGNVSPCKKKSRGFYSYLPNLHYQNLIDKYWKPGARVIIYTSGKSFEDLNEFKHRGYEVNTGTSLKEMWIDFVTADVFIMSRSDFSMVPAMVAKGIVVYTPFWHHQLRRWKRVPKSIMEKTEDETVRLQEAKCVFDVD